MKKRILTALIGIPLFLWGIVQGGWLWAGLIGAVAVVGSLESVRLVGVGRPGWERWFAAVAACGIAVASYIRSDSDAPLVVPAAFSVVFAVVLGYLALSKVPSRLSFTRPATALFAVVYPSYFLSHLIFLRADGWQLAAFAVLVTWATDTAAFFGGTRFGKRRLAPRISPNKSVEGGLFGLGFAALFSVIWGAVFGPGPLQAGAVGLLASAMAQLGDLVESGIKRKAGVKDSGVLLPGHGGVLDRFDSLIFSGTAVYCLSTLFGSL